MFIVTPDSSDESVQLLQNIKDQFGQIPPHFRFFAQIHPKRFAMFLQEVAYLANHPRIKSDFFTFLRLFVATREGFAYCQKFNTKMLLMRGYTKEQIKKAAKDIREIALDERHRELAFSAMSAIYDPVHFDKETIQKLQKMDWTLRDIFDAVDHATFLLKNGRILQAFLISS